MDILKAILIVTGVWCGGFMIGTNVGYNSCKEDFKNNKIKYETIIKTDTVLVEVK